MDAIFLSLQQFSFGTVVSVVATLFLIDGYFKKAQRMQSSGLPLPIVIPGLPLIGNLLQLKEKKPHKTFAQWAEKYGPIYSIKAGSSTLVILNSNDVAKERKS